MLDAVVELCSDACVCVLGGCGAQCGAAAEDDDDDEAAASAPVSLDVCMYVLVCQCTDDELLLLSKKKKSHVKKHT